MNKKPEIWLPPKPGLIKGIEPDNPDDTPLPEKVVIYLHFFCDCLPITGKLVWRSVCDVPITPYGIVKCNYRGVDLHLNMNKYETKGRRAKDIIKKLKPGENLEIKHTRTAYITGK